MAWMPIDEFGCRCYTEFLGFIRESSVTLDAYSLHRDMEYGFFTVGWFSKDMDYDDIDMEIIIGDKLSFTELFDGQSFGVGIVAKPVVFKKRVVVK